MYIVEHGKPTEAIYVVDTRNGAEVVTFGESLPYAVRLEEATKLAERLNAEAEVNMFRRPEEPDPGSGWYLLTYGEKSGWWVNVDTVDTVMLSTGDVVLAADYDRFASEHYGI